MRIKGFRNVKRKTVMQLCLLFSSRFLENKSVSVFKNVTLILLHIFHPGQIDSFSSFGIQSKLLFLNAYKHFLASVRLKKNKASFELYYGNFLNMIQTPKSTEEVSKRILTFATCVDCSSPLPICLQTDSFQMDNCLQDITQEAKPVDCATEP